MNAIAEAGKTKPIQTQSNPMEAGGFEPPSRDVLRQASTCLVALLFFALPNAKRQAPDSAISELILPCRPEQPARPACYLTPFSGPQAKPERTGYLIRLPFVTGSYQLIVCRMISQANRRPGHATCLSAIRSKPFAPILTFQ